MKVKVISIVSVVVILILSIGGYFLHQKREEEKIITEKVGEISEIEKSFDKTEVREEKMEILKSTIKEMSKYSKSKESLEEIIRKYKTTVSTMQNFFVKEYDSILKENTLEDLDSLEDIETITTNKDNLTSLLSKIETEKEYTLSSDDDYEKYKEEITQLNKSYEDRISVVEEAKKKAEEEAQRQAEEEARKKAEEEKAKTHYENEYFTITVPQEWVGAWSVEPGEDYRNNSNAIAVYMASYNSKEGYGGGAEIYVLEVKNPETDRLGYGNFTLPDGGTYVGETTSGKFVFVMTEAGAGFFSAGATIEVI